MRATRQHTTRPIHVASYQRPARVIHAEDSPERSWPDSLLRTEGCSPTEQLFVWKFGGERIIYTTKFIEPLNAKLRRAFRARGHFSNDDAAAKLLFLVLNRSEKEWTIPPMEWTMAKAQFAVVFDEGFTRAMA